MAKYDILGRLLVEGEYSTVLTTLARSRSYIPNFSYIDKIFISVNNWRNEG